jgi:hypothetical protein
LPEAIAAHRRAVALDPRSATFHSNLALALKDEGLFDESIEVSRKSVLLDFCHDAERFNHSLTLLMEGDYEAGWPAYEVRRKRLERGAK